LLRRGKKQKARDFEKLSLPYGHDDRYAEEQVSAFTTTAGGHVKESLMSVL